MRSLVEGVERLSGDSHRVSRGYVLAAWVFLAISVLAWPWFATAALAFYVSAIVLRREGF